MSKNNDRTYRAYTCQRCANKNGWKDQVLVGVDMGQCFFCGRVGVDLFETPLLVLKSSKSKKKKEDRVWEKFDGKRS